jgi:hypothetical protein
MKVIRRTLNLAIAALLLSLPLSASVQWDKKPPTEWSEKDVQKLINDSAWAKTQVFSSAVTLFRNTTAGSAGTGRGVPDNSANATHISFHIRFLSAKPVRQAISRMMELREIKEKQRISDSLAAQLKTFAGGEFLEIIVITVTCDSSEPGANVQQAMSLLHSRGTAELRNNTFLETKGGRRLFLKEFQPPRQDGLGARFIFDRLVDGKPFITPESEEIHFVAELDGTYRLDRRYKIKEMMYDGKLEY